MDVERRLPHRISLGVEQYTSIAASADGRRLVATVSNPDTGLWRVPISDRTVEESAARRIAHAYGIWGRGVSPAALNFGDCFAYEVAKEHACRLLYVGDDFSKTDVEGVL